AYDEDLTGRAKDRAGGVLVGARVVVMTPQRAVVANTLTDKDGAFTFKGLPDGQYLVVATYPSLTEAQVVVTIPQDEPGPIELTLDVSPVRQEASVTALLGGIADRSTLTQP